MHEFQILSFIYHGCMPCDSKTYQGCILPVSLSPFFIYPRFMTMFFLTPSWMNVFSLSFIYHVCMPHCFLHLSWMYAIVFHWSTMDVLISLSFKYHECIHHSLWRSIMDVCPNLSFIYYVHMLWCFIDLSWMHALLFPWSIMDVSFSVPSVHHGCMP